LDHGQEQPRREGRRQGGSQSGEVAVVEDDFWIDHYRRPIGCKYSLLIGLKQTGQGDSNLELGQ
jgi:hypothetical protein